VNREGRGTSLVIKLILTNSATRKLFVAVRLKRVPARVPPKALSRWGPHSSSEVSSSPLKHAARPSAWGTNAATFFLKLSGWSSGLIRGRGSGAKKEPVRGGPVRNPPAKKSIMKTRVLDWFITYSSRFFCKNRAFPVRLPVSPDWTILVLSSGLFL